MIVYDNRKYEDSVMYQFGHHNMFSDELSKAMIIDTYPNFWIEYGNGRIITCLWNQFIRHIKHYLWKKRIHTLKMVLFWKRTRRNKLRKYRPLLPDSIILYIESYL